MRSIAVLILLLAVLAGCSDRADLPAPPRSETEPVFAPMVSSVMVPVSLSLDSIEKQLEAATPHKLWSIDERRTCVAGQHVRVLGEDLKVSPDIACHITGEVIRGRISLSGRGENLTITMPVRATVNARDTGDVLKGETATAGATLRARVQLSLGKDWQPRARVDLSYDWREPPGIEILGQRIEFMSRADRELAGVIAGLERDLQREIARIDLRSSLEEAWRAGFTVVSLNREKPPAWLRVTPNALGFRGYRVSGRTVELLVSARAETETFVSDDKPSAKAPTPLPDQMERIAEDGLHFRIPVFADYAQLEPVVLRALRKLAAKGIQLEGVGSVNADFRKVTIYATDGGRLAVGIDAEIEPVGERTGRWARAKGRAWLTGLPLTEPDSQVVRVSDLQIFAEADQVAADLLLTVLASEPLREEIATALTQDFNRDYDKVLVAARKAVSSLRVGPLRASATIGEIHHDAVQVTGAGLFMPLVATGKAEVTLEP